jgi:diguanylate cyclase (GGDEF)-like protein
MATGPIGASTAAPPPTRVRDVMTRDAVRTSARRAMTRLSADPHVLLAMAVVLAALVIEVAAAGNPMPIVVPSIVYLLIQMSLTPPGPTHRGGPLDTFRLLIALAAVTWMSLWSGDLGVLPLAPLYIPIVALAAVIGLRPAAVVGATAMVGYFIPVLTAATIQPGLLQRGVGLIATMVLIIVGTRRAVSQMERAVGHARAAMAGQRRRGRQISAVEAVGRTLAAHGPTTDTLDEVMDLLVARFGYRYVSIYTTDGPLMRLGAQRGYDAPIEVFDGSAGVVGRVMRTGKAELVRDVTVDPDYVAARSDVRSEVSVPLAVDGTLLGVLNVESDPDHQLDDGDRDTMALIGDRVASALALAREREALRDRADLFARLAGFGMTISASLDLANAHQTIIGAVAEVLETDIAALVLREPLTGEDRIVAMQGGDVRFVGVAIPGGEGMSGQAIAQRRTVTQAILPREGLPSTLRRALLPDLLTAAAFPLVYNDRIVGAVTVTRTDLTRPFTDLELEAMPMVASQIALVLRNVELHAQVADAAIRDPLTGLWNRRHLDVSLERLFAARARLDPGLRHPVAAILFDLDNFGMFNKQHGHGTGDVVLRAFGAILRRRLRASDLVARFGGEEFVAILDGATLEDADRIANEIRRELEAIRVPGIDGATLGATVSAGCAQLGPDVASFEAFLEVADVGLQMAKRGGRNQVVAA